LSARLKVLTIHRLARLELKARYRTSTAGSQREYEASVGVKTPFKADVADRVFDVGGPFIQTSTMILFEG